MQWVGEWFRDDERTADSFVRFGEFPEEIVVALFKQREVED